jgi:hypothetical protein
LKKINQFKDSRFSIIASGGITNTMPDKEISLPELVAIYQNKAIKEICKKISIETDPIKRKELKLLLPYITPHGTFTKRADELITSYNKNILAIDIDYIKPGAELKKVFNAVKSAAGCLLAASSASGKGIKALFYIEYKNSDNVSDHFQLLKKNINLIAAAVGLTQLKLKSIDEPAKFLELDKMQFVLSQAFFVFKGDLFYFNTRPPAALKLDFEPLPPAEPIKPFISIKINTEQQPTVNEMLLQRLSVVIDSLIPGRTGRHHQIYKFRDIAKLKNYSDHVQQQKLFDISWQAVCDLYGNERTARQENAYKSLLTVFDKTPAENDPEIDSLITAAN